MEPTLLGMENELSLAVNDPALQPRLPLVAAKLIEFLRQDNVSLPFKEGSANPPGVMLANGNRIYIDANNFVENASAEVRRPETLLAYQRAGELLLLQALDKASHVSGIATEAIRLVRAVTDYDGHYCGAHLNVLLRRHQASDIVAYLVPFLVTRYYACAGGWGPTGFSMSQKAQAIRCVSSSDTRENRGIVNLKSEPLASGGLKRAHITVADALMAELGTYLTAGCTALVLKMIDDGACVGPAMTMSDPVSTIHQLDTDLMWTRPVQLACGAEASPLQIQEHYLRAAEAYTDNAPEPWMSDVVVRWRETLESLRKGPATLTRKLDPFIKMSLFSRMLAARGMDMREFGKWCGAIWLMRPYVNLDNLPRRGAREYLRERLPFVTFQLVEERMAKQRLSWHDLRRALMLWRTMLLADLAYHDIDGERGLFFRLRLAGTVNSRLCSDMEIARAMTEAPRDTRAAARSRAIHELHGSDGATANWCWVASADRVMQLGDPFAVHGEWVSAPQRPRGKRR